jgi:hypothetical protein
MLFMFSSDRVSLPASRLQGVCSSLFFQCSQSLLRRATICWLKLLLGLAVLLHRCVSLLLARRYVWRWLPCGLRCGVSVAARLLLAIWACELLCVMRCCFWVTFGCCTWAAGSRH